MSAQARNRDALAYAAARAGVIAFNSAGASFATRAPSDIQVKIRAGLTSTAGLDSTRAGFVRFERIERPAPPILKIEDRHAEQKHCIVFWSPPAKYLAVFAAKFLK